MKKVLSLIFISTLLVACDTDYTDGNFPRDLESGWIEFGATSASVPDNSEDVEVPVLLETSTNNVSDVTVDIEIEATSGSLPSEYPTNIQVVVPVNQNTVDLELPVISSGSDYTLEATIVNVSKPNVIVGLEGNHPITFALQVCNTDIAPTYNGAASIDGDQINSFEANLTPVEGEENVYQIDSAWGTNFVAEATGDPTNDGILVYSGTLTINDDFSVEIVGNQPETPGGSGTYDPCTKTFTYSLLQEVFLPQEEGADPFEVGVVLTLPTEE
ncbi:hypothetical protein [Psychroflexus montanilacus]|uniref:hypothetical protein n=1 Tax=Psychroflexus montanilacus TaxID=2873598 RepID=UPI001CCCA89B|nr:hypothetical protein [Psychroflexus montanilacus]MBZ9651910.1 hypothetical protein [Psychroflexus montanilacus]